MSDWIRVYKCVKCGHQWIPRKENPVQCPWCKNKNWQDSKTKSKE